MIVLFFVTNVYYKINKILIEYISNILLKFTTEVNT